MNRLMVWFGRFERSHFGQQVWRFVRLFVATLIPIVAAYDGPWDRSALLAAVVPAVEVAFRQVVRVTASSVVSDGGV